MARNRAEMQRAADDVRAFYRAGVVELEHQLVKAATVRQGRAPGAPVDEGELRGSVRITLNSPSSEEPKPRSFYPTPGATEVDQALAAYQIGDTVWNRWIAEHAAIIEGGRRVSSLGRMIGSDQAPDGFLHLARDEALSRMDRWRF